MKQRVAGTCISISLLASLAFVSGCGGSEAPSSEPAAAVAEESAAPAARKDGYAPVLVAPRKLPDDPGAQMAVMMLENTVVPSASEVGIPKYPDAKVMSAMAGMSMTSNGEKMTTWPAMAMLSADEAADVAAFYQEQLSDWQYNEMMGMHSFWNGDENSNPLDVTGQFALVVVVPVAEDDTIRAMWPETRTRIDIRYEPSSP